MLKRTIFASNRHKLPIHLNVRMPYVLIKELTYLLTLDTGVSKRIAVSIFQFQQINQQ